MGEVLASFGSRERINFQPDSYGNTRTHLHDENANLSSSSPALLQQQQQQGQERDKPWLRLNVSATQTLNISADSVTGKIMRDTCFKF